MKDTTNTKSRNYFLTVNENAECFKTFEAIVSTLGVKYAYILHSLDADVNSHFHALICFDNPRHFSGVHKLFTGAHIEVIKSFSLCFMYLTHENDSSKYQYNKADIISNDIDYFNLKASAATFEVLTTETLLEHLDNARDISSLSDAVKIFGINQVNRYRSLIYSLIQEKGLIHADVSRDIRADAFFEGLKDR